MTARYLGIEIGGTKLQLGVGADDGKLLAQWRGTVDPERGAEGIREQIAAALPTLPMAGVRGVGIGFGGPVDDATSTVIRSHQIEGWDGFPLADWVSEQVGVSAVLGNDADVAGLAEARHGAGKGLSPIFYVTVGTGIGGGLIIDERIYRGVGRGAAEIGQLRILNPRDRAGMGPLMRLEALSSGSGIEWFGRSIERLGGDLSSIHRHCPDRHITAVGIAAAAREGDEAARSVLAHAWEALAEALSHVIALLCPRRIVIGGGVSLMGEELFFAPLRRLVADRVFEPFAGLTDIVPAALGEEVVVHGAVALARQRLG